jgi:hypothetical protein
MSMLGHELQLGEIEGRLDAAEWWIHMITLEVDLVETIYNFLLSKWSSMKSKQPSELDDWSSFDQL